MDGVRKVWFTKGSTFECFACQSPYEKENIISEGLPVDIWVKTPFFEKQNP
jgi:hypothetical protein